MLLSACQYPSASVIPTSPVPTQETGQEVFCDSWDEEWISSNHDLTDTIIDGKRSVEIDLSITSQGAGCKGLDLSLLLDSTVSSSQIELDVLNSWLGSDQELSGGVARHQSMGLYRQKRHGGDLYDSNRRV